jgi:hypothetical protein
MGIAGNLKLFQEFQKTLQDERYQYDSAGQGTGIICLDSFQSLG